MDFSLITYYVMLPLLEYFRQLMGSYGWSIIMVTVVIKAVLLPLSIKQMQMSQQMQAQMAKIKPDLEKIQDRYKQRKKKYETNPEKLEEVQKEFQEQITNLYKTQGGINPLGGCLPTVLQLPILIALYWTFSGPPFQPSVLNIPVEATAKVQTKEQASLKKLKSNTANFIDHNGKIIRLKISSDIPEKLLVGEEYKLKIDKTLGEGDLPKETAVWNLLAKGANPAQVKAPSLEKEQNKWSDGVIEFSQNSESPFTATIKALKETEKFHIQFHVDETRAHQKFFFIQDLGRVGLWDAITKQLHWDVLVLVVLMGASFWVSNKLMIDSNPQPPSLDPAQEEMQKQMQTLMPVMFLGMMAFLPIPSGVFIYFIVSNVIQLAQTLIMKKFFPVTTAAKSSVEAITQGEEKVKV
ncbi:MAG: membrane protein insertase YidC [Candidatus Caenarcaniphilales bacterium]|nr:membrane protein insertase YidC [Candidatus Caenarcaniphilales bacterium]